jgi:hypothetical protein
MDNLSIIIANLEAKAATFASEEASQAMAAAIAAARGGDFTGAVALVKSAELAELRPVAKAAEAEALAAAEKACAKMRADSARAERDAEAKRLAARARAEARVSAREDAGDKWLLGTRPFRSSLDKDYKFFVRRTLSVAAAQAAKATESETAAEGLAVRASRAEARLHAALASGDMVSALEAESGRGVAAMAREELLVQAYGLRQQATRTAESAVLDAARAYEQAFRKDRRLDSAWGRRIAEYGVDSAVLRAAIWRFASDGGAQPAEASTEIKREFDSLLSSIAQK